MVNYLGNERFRANLKDSLRKSIISDVYYQYVMNQMSRKREIRALLDTSVLVPPKTRKKLVNAADEGLFVAYWSPAIIGELYRVLTVQFLEKGFTEEKISVLSKKMMAILTSVFEIADPKPPFPPGWLDEGDVDDIPMWAAAKLIDADFVVSNNTNDFPPRDAQGRAIYEGIEYIKPVDFLQRIGFEEI